MKRWCSFSQNALRVILLALSCFTIYSAEKCDFKNSEQISQQKLYCDVSENAKNGSAADCRNITVIDGDEVTTDVKPHFLVVLEDKTNLVRLIVNSNLTAILQQDNSDGNAKNVVTQVVTCKPGPTSMEAIITIKPENNNAPKFNKTLYDFEVKKTDKKDHLINEELIIVTDIDYKGDPVSDVSVNISSGNDDGAFRLVQNIRDKKNKHSTFEVQLLLEKSLRYKREEYVIVLTATDRGTPPLTSTAEVKVRVIDVDTQDPIFDYPVYTSTIYITEKERGKFFVSKTTEDMGTEFHDEFQITTSPKPLFAYDQDFGINTTVLYEMVSDNVTFANYFELNNDTAELTLKKIDEYFLEAKSTSLLVKTYQEDDETRQAFAMVNINIHIKMIGQQPSFTHRVTIPRTQQVHMAFYTIESSGEKLKYDISGANSVKFDLQGKNLQLKEAIADDVTTMDIDVTVTSMDSLIETKNRMKIIFLVEDVLFKKDIYAIDILADAAINSNLFEIETAIPAAQLTISKTEPKDAANLFEIQEKKIILKRKLNPSIQLYSLHIIGKLNTANRNDSTIVHMHVINLNRTLESFFEKSHYIVDVLECTKPPTDIFSIHLPMENVKLEVIDGSKEHFFVNQTTGNIILLKELNKTVDTYYLDLQGTLEGNRKDRTKVTFHVQSCKKVKNYFDKSIYDAKVRKDTKKGTVLLRFKPETDESVEYIIMSGVDKDEFTIKPGGQFVLNIPGSQLKRDLYHIVVSASDSTGQNETINDETTLVIVTFEREPIFQHSIPLVKVFAPSALLSEFVFTIQVKPTGRDVTFFLKDDKNYFDINKNTGLVFPLIDVTKEDGLQTVLQVTAKYSEDLTSQLTVHIFRLKWEQTLKLTLSASPTYSEVEKITTKMSDVTGRNVILMQYQLLQDSRNRFVKRSANKRLVMNMAVVQKTPPKPLSLKEFQNLNVSKELEKEIGKFQIEQQPENGQNDKHSGPSPVYNSNTGLVAGVVVLSLFLFAVLAVAVLLFISKRYSVRIPLISKLPSLFKTSSSIIKGETRTETQLKNWRPPTPPLRRTTDENSYVTPTASKGIMLCGTENNAFQKESEDEKTYVNLSFVIIIIHLGILTNG